MSFMYAEHYVLGHKVVSRVGRFYIEGIRIKRPITNLHEVERLIRTYFSHHPNTKLE